MLNCGNKIKGFPIGTAIAVCVAALFFPAYASFSESKLLLVDYTVFFNEDVTIVVGGNACKVVIENASVLAARLKKLTENEPIIKKDVTVSEENKTDCNLVLIGISNSNYLLSEAYDITDATKVTAKFPGRQKGILKNFTSPWSEDKTLLIIAGSDQWGVKAGLVALTGSHEIEVYKLNVKCEEIRKPRFPFLSKIDAALSLLLTLREREKVPQEMKRIFVRDTVSVSIRFTHELNTSEVQSIEELGLEFVRLPNGEVAHSGNIYGAEVPWDRVYDLSEMENVVRVESVWQPGVEAPVGDNI